MSGALTSGLAFIVGLFLGWLLGLFVAAYRWVQTTCAHRLELHAATAIEPNSAPAPDDGLPHGANAILGVCYRCRDCGWSGAGDVTAAIPPEWARTPATVNGMGWDELSRRREIEHRRSDRTPGAGASAPWGPTRRRGGRP